MNTHTHTRHQVDLSQQRELISPLLHPHLQQALDSPTTTSRPFLSTVRKASSTSSEMGERTGLLNTGPSCSSCATARVLRSVECWVNEEPGRSSELSAASLSSELNKSSISSVQHERRQTIQQSKEWIKMMYFIVYEAYQSNKKEKPF